MMVIVFVVSTVSNPDAAYSHSVARLSTVLLLVLLSLFSILGHAEGDAQGEAEVATAYTYGYGTYYHLDATAAEKATANTNNIDVAYARRDDSRTATGFSECPQKFYAAQAPDYLEPNLLKDSQPLCFHGFAVMYSGVSRTPLWSAEYLTRERLQQAEQLPRKDSFHEESRLPQSMRATLRDYSGSGFDRGHLAPNGNMADVNQQYDSFSLANIAPQVPRHNRYLWRDIESSTRYLARRYGQVYVVTGVAFTDPELIQLNGNVLVPSHFFKAVYIPSLREAGVYYSPNDESDRMEIISLDELALRTGIDAMPAVASASKARAYALPTRDSDDIDEVSEGLFAWWQVLTEVWRWLVTKLSA